MAEMTIRRFGVWSVAKMNAILWFIFGLIVGVIYGLFFIMFGAAMSSLAPEAEAAAMSGVGSVVTGVIFMIGMPIFYGLTGLIAGAIGALVYNALSGIIGGIKFELEGVQHEYAPPPPPTDWAPNQYPAQ
jgi:hypothetical protein